MGLNPAVALIPLALLALTILVVAVRARRRRRKPARGREASAVVILEGNLWDACTVDDLKEPWSRYTTEPVRGFCGVSAGRHRVRTQTPAGEATLDFVAYPGEVLAWRLDAERGRWEPHELDPDTRAPLEIAAPTSSTDVAATRPKLPGWLVHLRTTAGVGGNRIGPRVRGEGLVLPKPSEDGVERLKKRLGKLVGIAESDEEGDALTEAKAIGEAIIGRPLSRREMRSLVAHARQIAERRVVSGHTDRALRVVAVGLAVLPGDPELMVTAGCALATRGETDEALHALNTALERDRCLEADDVARAMRARMELRSRLGRSVRV